MPLLRVLSVFLCLHPAIVNNFNHKLVKDVLNYRHLSRILILGCDEGNISRRKRWYHQNIMLIEITFSHHAELASTARMLLQNGFYVQSKRLASREPLYIDSSTEFLRSNQQAVVADISCSNFTRFLQQVSYVLFVRKTVMLI